MNAPAPIAALLADGNVSAELRQTLTDVLADAGSRSIPYFLVDTCEGEEIERLRVADTTIRLHANRAQRWSRISHEWEYGDDGEVVAAVSINEISRIEP